MAPGVISPRRKVPSSIARPEYVGKAVPTEVRGNDVNDAETIEAIRIASRIAARALVEVGKAVASGVTTDELDRIGHEYMIVNGAYPSTLGYRGFPKSLCTSVNEVVCHGIPDSTVLRDGDIVKVDITAYLGGVHGDNCATFGVGEISEAAALLIERTRESLARSIKAVVPGREVNVLGRVIEKFARRFDYGVVRDYTGHGVGRAFHSGLVIPHYDSAPDYSTVIEPGMVFTIEPMLTLGTEQCIMWDDDWTVLTADGSLTAQFEHTLLVTETGAEILTLP